MTKRERGESAERQARFKQRMEARGFRRAYVWRHAASDAAGYERGCAGEPPVPGPAVEDARSYLEGWLRGAGDRIVPVVCTLCGQQVGEGPAREHLDPITGKPQRLVCEACEERLRSIPRL